MIYLKLFWAFFKVGLFAIGGTYSFIPVIEREIVENYAWMTKSEFLDVLGMARVIPGAVSVKFATYVGYKIANFWGAVFANLGNIFPAAISIFLALYFYSRYKDIKWVENGFDMVKIAIAAMIVLVLLKTMDYKTLLNFKGVIVLVSTILLSLLTKIHPGLIIVVVYIFGAFFGK